MITEREKLEFESLPEFVREPRNSTREQYVSQIASKPAIERVEEPVEPIAAPPKTAELEALWPGINHDVFHAAAPKKGATFYLTIGFMAGAVASMLFAWGFSAVSHWTASGSQGEKQIVVADANKNIRQEASGAVVPNGAAEPETILPVSTIYEVASGDTLAGIALKNYHRATPRLLDEICRANNMRNANVLSLGQKLTLPEYHPQSRQIATGANQAQQ